MKSRFFYSSAGSWVLEVSWSKTTQETATKSNFNRSDLFYSHGYWCQGMAALEQKRVTGSSEEDQDFWLQCQFTVA